MTQGTPGNRDAVGHAGVGGGLSGSGITIVGTGSALPKAVVANSDLERMMDTSDEWIVQRTGIHTRRRIDRAKGESTFTLGARALERALEMAGLAADELDLVICATMTPEMGCPPTACLIVDAVKARKAGAFDLNGACCGFVYGMNVVHAMMRGGAAAGSNAGGGGQCRTVALIGSDCLTTLMDYSTAGRGTAILFGDAAGAMIFRTSDNPAQGILAQSIHCDGRGWKEIFVPYCEQDFPPAGAGGEDHSRESARYGHVQMNGAGVFKFAVGTFPNLIQETLDKVNLKASDVDMYVCHQSNARILNAARERFGLPADKLHINIDRVGNTVAASVPLCLDELVRAGRVKLGSGQKVMFVGFGGGLTWGSSLWQL